MPLRLAGLSWDAINPPELARFWAAALDWHIETEAGVIRLRPGDGTNFKLAFLPAMEEKTGPNWVHFDLTSWSLDDQLKTAQRYVGLGARRIDIGQGSDATHIVLADPEGNEFCILEPENNFTTKASRLGSLTCEGTHDMGVFWSAALDRPLVWDQDDETAIRVEGGAEQFITWGGYRTADTEKNRMRYDVAPSSGSNRETEVERLLALGAERADSHRRDVPGVFMTDPDGNEFCLLTAG